jgi:hypothetical protein
MPDHSKPAAAPSVPVCRYEAASVTVELTNANNCPVLQQSLEHETGKGWVSVPASSGRIFASLRKGPLHIYIYDSGNRPLAIDICNWFRKMQWQLERKKTEPGTSRAPFA